MNVIYVETFRREVLGGRPHGVRLNGHPHVGRDCEALPSRARRLRRLPLDLGLRRSVREGDETPLGFARPAERPEASYGWPTSASKRTPSPLPSPPGPRR